MGNSDVFGRRFDEFSEVTYEAVEGISAHEDRAGTIIFRDRWQTRSRPFRRAISNDNPFSETLFGTLKYRPDMPLKPFADLEVACAWVTKLVRWYNH